MVLMPEVTIPRKAELYSPSAMLVMTALPSFGRTSKIDLNWQDSFSSSDEKRIQCVANISWQEPGACVVVFLEFAAS